MTAVNLISIFFSTFKQRANEEMAKNNMTSICSFQGRTGAEDNFHQALLDCCLSASKLPELENNRDQLQFFYQGKPPYGHCSLIKMYLGGNLP